MGRRVLAVAYPPEMPMVDDPIGAASAAEHEAHFSRLDAAIAERIPEFRAPKSYRRSGGRRTSLRTSTRSSGWAPELGGLHLAVGFSGHRLKLSPAVGEIVASAVLDLDPPFDPSPLGPSRFAEDDLMYLAYGPGARA